MDSWFYGRLTFTPWVFLKTNVLQQISLFYGANPWHFYFSQALPFDMLALLPFTLHGAYTLWRNEPHSAACAGLQAALGAMLVLSLLSHKEFRFIQAFLPIFHSVSAYSLLHIGKNRSTDSGVRWLHDVRAILVKFILVVNIPATLFFIAVHQRGQVAVAAWMSSSASHEVQSLSYLMPCHSTPWQSHMHRPGEVVHNGSSTSIIGTYIWALTCEPPLK